MGEIRCRAVQNSNWKFLKEPALFLVLQVAESRLHVLVQLVKVLTDLLLAVLNRILQRMAKEMH